MKLTLTTFLAVALVVAMSTSTAFAIPRPMCGRYAMSLISLPDHVAPRARAGERTFARAMRDYDRGRSRRAARRFMSAARSFLDDPNLTATRMTAYNNAAFAWAMANRLDEARSELTRAAQNDTANARALADLLERLPTPCAR